MCCTDLFDAGLGEQLSIGRGGQDVVVKQNNTDSAQLKTKTGSSPRSAHLLQVRSAVFDNYFSDRCGDENITTIFLCKMKNKVKIMNSLLLIKSFYQFMSSYYHQNKTGMPKANMTTRQYSLIAISS